MLISNSHAESTASRLRQPLYEMGFPVYKTFGYTSKVTIGYRGTLAMISEMANLLMKSIELIPPHPTPPIEGGDVRGLIYVLLPSVGEGLG